MTTHLCGHAVNSHAVVIACVLLGIAGCVAWGLYGWWADWRWRAAAGQHPAVKVERGRLR